MFWIIIAVLAIIVVWVIYAYNRFIRMSVRVDEGWSDIEVQLKRRYDLISNLVNTVKGYATHEKTAFENVTKARAAAMGLPAQAGAQDHAQAENMLTGALKSLFAIAEAYPELKANVNFLELQRELSDTENKIQAARRFYNSVVRDLNTSVDTFPPNLIANIFRFTKREFFDIDDSGPESQPVKVNF